MSASFDSNAPTPQPDPDANAPAPGEVWTSSDDETLGLNAPAVPDTDPLRVPGLTARRRGRRMAKPEPPRASLTGEQRLLILDAWERSGLPATDFAGLVGLSKHTLYAWRKRFREEGPAGLLNAKKRGRRRGSRIPDTTQRAILLLKREHPDWGSERIHDVLARSDGFQASPGAILRVLRENGYEVEEAPTRPHPPQVRRFERAKPNQLWQTDLFTFVLKRQNKRVYLVAYMDDHSRFIVGFGLHGTASGAMVRETFEAAAANHGCPEEVLTDNGTQYVTWRGKSAFTKMLERRGVRQVVAKPRRPQTLGKIERFWGTLWRELVEESLFRDLSDARERLQLFVDHYNFQRPHQGIDGLVPADRFFGAASEVKQTLADQIAANSIDLARHGTPRKPFYLTGRVGDSSLSLHAEGERVILTREDGSREEVDLQALGQRAEPEEPAAEPPTETEEPSS